MDPTAAKLIAKAVDSCAESAGPVPRMSGAGKAEFGTAADPEAVPLEDTEGIDVLVRISVLPRMAERKFGVAIVGRGAYCSIQLKESPFAFGDLRSSIKTEYGLNPNEMATLELRRVDEEPKRLNADELFKAESARPIESSADLNNVHFIVGKIGEPAGSECLRECTRTRRVSLRDPLLHAR